MKNALLLLLLVAVVAVLNGAASAFNITEILADDTSYSTFNQYLTETKLADEINSRTTITVLALNNTAMSALTANLSLSDIKSVLSLHVLLDYYDPSKLHNISNGTTLTTNLYQTTGNQGFVNITDLPGGKVGIGSAANGSKLDASYVKSVKQVPYNISVLEVSSPIIAPGILSAPAPSLSEVNITGVLEKAGCKTFAGLLVSTGVLKTYQSAVVKALTIFAPNDEAFKAKGVPDLSKLTGPNLVKILEFHASPGYYPSGSLKTSKSPMSTLASKGTVKFEVTTSTNGDSVTLHTGVDTSRVANTALDVPPLVIFTVDNVLLPTELFEKSPLQAPAPEPVPSPSRAPAKSPTPSPYNAPSASPPEPASESLGDAPTGPGSTIARKKDGVLSLIFLLLVPALGAVLVLLLVCYLVGLILWGICRVDQQKPQQLRTTPRLS